MTVRIVSSKSDQYRQGDSVIVARTGSSACPVAMLERYYAMAGCTTQVVKTTPVPGYCSY